MIKQFLSKYLLEVIPSIVATVVGAYIVTNYISGRPNDKPAAAVSAPAVPAKAPAVPAKAMADVPGTDSPKTDSPKTEAAKPEPRKAELSKAEPSEPLRSESSRPEPSRSESVKAEPGPAKPETVEAEKSEKFAPAARVLRHHQIVTRERAAKAATAEKEAVPAAEDRRDANDMARAAIERLRGAEPRTVETRTPERRLNTVGYAPAAAPLPSPAPPVYAPPPVQAAQPPAVYTPPPAREASVPPAPAVVPMLPAINVAPLPVPPPASVTQTEDLSRPTPPADIPSRQPIDIGAKENASVAEDVVSAAKNAFQAVLPR